MRNVKNIQYYSHLCACGCGEKMEIKFHHKYYGIPQYINYHTPNKGNKKKHGGSKSKIYNMLNHMKNRCLNPNFKQYKDYGGRGITICPEWTDKKNGFIKFRDWALNNGYQEGLEIDRIDNNGNYSPENCRFVTRTKNNRNQRTTKINMEKANEIRALYKTNKYTQKEISKIYNICESNICNIIKERRWKQNNT